MAGKERIVVASGDVFGMLTVIAEAGRDKRGNKLYTVQCSCGSPLKEVRKFDLTRTRGTTSCGCLRKERSTTHGLYGTPEYRVWDGIIDRTTNENHPYWHRYGGRGITMWADWISDPAAFIAYIGERPSNKHQIDRIDNSVGYIPGNLRWATALENTRNRDCVELVEFQGETKPLGEFCELQNLKYKTVYHRIHTNKWSVDRALSTPVG